MVLVKFRFIVFVRSTANSHTFHKIVVTSHSELSCDPDLPQTKFGIEEQVQNIIEPT